MQQPLHDKNLIKKNGQASEYTSLKNMILDVENKVLANTGEDGFEELFKLIFTKLYDETQSGLDESRYFVFRNYGETETDLKNKIQTLFDTAKKMWGGIFKADDKIMLTPPHLSVCVELMQGATLLNSNLDVLDEVFEYLINKSSKGEKGQYFTPRYVIDMCVKMLNPQKHETMIDTAAGSCAFPIHTMFYVWKQIQIDKGFNECHIFTLENKPQECIDYATDNVFAIDFDEKAVRVARTLNLIAGNGLINVLHLNTLDWERWSEIAEDTEWQDVYASNYEKLKKMRVKKDEDHKFKFDILMANPPFTGEIKDTRVLGNYDVAHSISLSKIKNVKNGHNVIHGIPPFSELLRNDGDRVYQAEDGTYHKANIRLKKTVGRDTLFIERNLDFLKPGGRMAIVLPQGHLNNCGDMYIREFIADRCRILAVVGLHSNVFKPHTGVKTSVLFVQKWNDDPTIGDLCPKKDDYKIFFAVMQSPSKDNSGKKIYVRMKDNGGYVLDDQGQAIVEHDLFNHNGLTEDGIAEEFIEFAKKERLSFFT